MKVSSRSSLLSEKSVENIHKERKQDVLAGIIMVLIWWPREL